jgi:hypothetical protein
MLRELSAQALAQRLRSIQLNAAGRWPKTRIISILIVLPPSIWIVRTHA